MIEDEKCAGILIESISTHEGGYPSLVVGVGVNIKSCPLENSTYINAHAENPIILDTFKNMFFDIFADYYSEWKDQGFKSFRNRFIKQTYSKDTEIGVKIGLQKVTGKFKNIDSEGNLELLCDKTKKIQKITSGDVFLM